MKNELIKKHKALLDVFDQLIIIIDGTQIFNCVSLYMHTSPGFVKSWARLTHTPLLCRSDLQARKMLTQAPLRRLALHVVTTGRCHQFVPILEVSYKTMHGGH